MNLVGNSPLKTKTCPVHGNIKVLPSTLYCPKPAGSRKRCSACGGVNNKHEAENCAGQFKEETIICLQTLEA